MVFSISLQIVFDICPNQCFANELYTHSMRPCQHFSPAVYEMWKEIDLSPQI